MYADQNFARLQLGRWRVLVAEHFGATERNATSVTYGTPAGDVPRLLDSRISARTWTGLNGVPSQGIASFYSEGQKTASGERFDARELTAAHPTLPFGTKLLVTNVDTGRSVTVRVNDRGPFVQGRVVDVSYSAAQSLGMVGKGLANVRLDVVQ